MADTPGNVRLVRCPKCENLLPEVTDYSVYRCGGCGSVLRATNKSAVSDTSWERSDDESLGAGFDKFSENKGNANLPKRRGLSLNERYENDAKYNGGSSSRAGEYNKVSLTRAEKWVVEEDMELNKNVHELGISETAERFKGLKLEGGNSTNGSRRSVRTYDWTSREEGEMDRFQNTQNTDTEGSMKLVGPPSNYRAGTDYAYAELVDNRVEYVEDDRAELLRKLDELKDQISRSGQMVDPSKEKVPPGRRVGYQDPYNSGPENWFPDGSNRVQMKYTMPDNMTRPQYGNFSDTSSHISTQGFGDPYGSNMVRRAPQRAPELLEQGQNRPYYSGQYTNKGVADMDLHDNYQHNRNLHHPSCSCYQCCNKHQQVPPVIAPSVLPNERFSDGPHHPVFYHHENLNGFAPRDYNPRFSNNPSTNSNLSRWASDVNSEFGGLVRPRPRRVLLASTASRCRPVAGGAPFITCSNCFESLQLPKKVLRNGKTQKKMRCAACSELIFISVIDKKLVLSMHSQSVEIPKKVDNRLNAIVNEGSSQTQGNTKWANTGFSSDGYDNLGFDFQSVDAKILSSPTGPSVGSNKSMRSHHSASSSVSADEEEPKAAELATKSTPPPPPTGSPLQDHFDYSTKYNRAGPGNISGRSEVNKVMSPLKIATRQNSMKEATEIEMPSNEYSNNTGSSQESGDAVREYQNKGSGGGESFFAGIIKKSFRDFSRSSQHDEEGRINVTVNGHPIPDRLVKKAEKLAGKIQPGNYWYDSRAGFWGVIGGPCRGIIPPFIEEFNHVMPEKCAGGNTGVFVNGRELHQKDLELLGSRGLPTDTDGSYIIEISGRVLDVESGEELDSLGKLAPTVEKAKHGFGMKVPRMTSGNCL